MWRTRRLRSCSLGALSSSWRACSTARTSESACQTMRRSSSSLISGAGISETVSQRRLPAKRPKAISGPTRSVNLVSKVISESASISRCHSRRASVHSSKALRCAAVLRSGFISNDYLHSLQVLTGEMGCDLVHEAMHLLLDQRVRLVADVEVQDHLLDAAFLHLLQRLDDLLRPAEQDRTLGKVLLLHALEDLDDLHEVLHGRRRVLGLLRKGL